MKKYQSPGRLVLLVLWITLFVVSCSEDEVKPSAEALAINNFVWDAMSQAYLWEKQLPQNIAIDQEFDPNAYFDKLLYKPLDRWSFITEDYEGLINSLKGVELSFGHNFQLFQISGNQIIGIVQYTVPDSPADRAGIGRGDIFYQVNGATLNTSNYAELLFNNTSYTVTFGTFDQSGELTPTQSVALTAEVVAENPLHTHRTIDFEGYKIGYLSYNQFIPDYDDSLVSVVKQFSDDGVTELVLDLRYNPGGAISSAILLSSMIAPRAVADNNEVYSRLFWNDGLTEYLIAEQGEESPNLLSRFITPEVSLDLSRVFILITANTASASEQVINCLAPYMDVVLVGQDNTSGKYVGSITIRAEDTDWDNWAIQPIVTKSANADGVSDYFDGFAPDYEVDDDYNAALGSLDEDMLARAVELITGVGIIDPGRISNAYFPSAGKIVMPQYERDRQRLYVDF
jgi:carboxyl-terminal processing protease